MPALRPFKKKKYPYERLEEGRRGGGRIPNGEFLKGRFKLAPVRLMVALVIEDGNKGQGVA